MGFLDKLFGAAEDAVCAPISGKAVPVSEVPDPTFGEEILGKGIAIIPSEGKIVAPCDGFIGMMFETGHAVSMTSDFGAEILIHVGLDTVALKGKYYKVHANDGDKVTKGQLLIEFDAKAIEEEGYNIITPIVICNSQDYSHFKAYTGTTVAAGDKVIGLKK